MTTWVRSLLIAYFGFLALVMFYSLAFRSDVDRVNRMKRRAEDPEWPRNDRVSDGIALVFFVGLLAALWW